MKDFLTYFALPLFVALLALWLGVTSSSDRLLAVTGFNVSYYEELKKTCEKSLPRDQVCKVVISFSVGGG